MATQHAPSTVGHSSSKAKPGTVSHSRTSNIKRLQQELREVCMGATGPLAPSAFPKGDNLFEWVATIKGVPGTVYDGLKYKLSMSFPPEYPYSAPTVRFITPCFHPNVDQFGAICIDILKEKWSAAYSVMSVLLSLQTLLGDPNNNSPLNTQAAEMWDNQEEFKTVLHAKYNQQAKSKSS